MSKAQKFQVSFNLNGSERRQVRPGPTAADAINRVKAEFAKHPHWGIPTDLKAEVR